MTAYTVAGQILEDAKCFGTYYVSCGLLATNGPTGRICDAALIQKLAESGHEVGCHTFSHCHAWDTAPAIFQESISQNRHAIRRILPDLSFRTFSYPISCPRPGNKAVVAKHFVACRGGGQTYNVGIADLMHLRAYFLEQAPGLDVVEQVIRENVAVGGWLIFATHDVAAQPTPYGCKPEFFEMVLREVRDSGAAVLPVSSALAECGVSPLKTHAL